MITGCRIIERNVKNQHFVFYDTVSFDVLLNISASSDRKKMVLPPFESSLRDNSNELWHIILRSLDAEILSSM